YSPGLGSCGEQHSDTDMIAAVSHELYDTFPGATANPNNNPVCGRNLKIGWKDKWITVKVVDRCEGCLKTDVDLSPGAFAKLEDMSVGRLRGIEVS
ncbi:RlpA-like double-psi beta-barrel-protein domain-containing protein-containing protein, partial [Phakopsora pachyrhizi]